MKALGGIQAAAGSVASSKALSALAVAAMAAVGALAVLAATVVMSITGAAGSVCAAGGGGGGGPSSPSSPGSPDSGGYVSQEPSEEALADIPDNYLESYKAAGEEYGIDWAVIAGIGKVETDHGRYSAGCEEGPPTPYGTAKGPMQFIDSTWDTQGVDGNGDGTADPCDPEDAIAAAAGYLRDSGAPEDYYSAIYAYNHADWYVQEVMGHAEGYRAAEEEGGGMQALIRAPENAASRGMDLFTSGTDLLKGGGALGSRAAGAEAQGWDAVDSEGRLDYENHSSYTSAVDHAVSAWNDLGSVPIEESSGSGTDIQVGDAYLQPGVAGYTSVDGSGATLTLNPEQMDGATTNAQNAIATHEFGHAVGIGHTGRPSVMNAPITTDSSSNNEIPTAYDEEVYYGLWGEPTNENVSNDDTLEGGGGEEGGIEGDTSAVFPLPSEHFDSYEDTWGASRGAGATHEGTDMFAPDGTEIYSITDGTVVSAAGSDSEGWNELGGWTTMIEATESVGPVQAGDTLYYAHQIEPSPVAPGDTVEAGDVIGKIGSTGEGPPGTLLQPASRGQHLHLGWYDPSGSRAEAASGAMNPYPLLEWLRESGGTASGGSPDGSGGGPAAPGWCPPGTGGGPGGEGGQVNDTEAVDPGSGDASELLENPNFSANDGAAADLESGQVDERLVAALQAVASEHDIHVSAIKSDHPMGPYVDGGYGSAGGAENAHYFHRAADIAEVDGMPVAGNGSSEAVLDVGRILAGIAPSERPDEIIGPPEWQAELAYPREAGFITDESLNLLHSDHLHLALASDSGTNNTR